MHSNIELSEKPTASEIYMIAGWHQWADAGAISSELPQYLIDHSDARLIGEITSDDYYLFQIPGTHHFLRPEIQLKDGYCESLATQRNEIYYTEFDDKGLVIFLGDEPHLNVAKYTEAFLDVAEALNVKRICAVGGVYGSMPYEKDREISCSYSLKPMQEELQDYALRFSQYQGGTTIASYMLKSAEARNQEFMVMYALVPAYDFSESDLNSQGIRIDEDYKAWYDIMQRLNYMFGINVDLNDLSAKADEITVMMAAKIAELEADYPQLNLKAYLEQLSAGFVEPSFAPLQVWEDELGDLLDGLDE